MFVCAAHFLLMLIAEKILLNDPLIGVTCSAVYFVHSSSITGEQARDNDDQRSRL